MREEGWMILFSRKNLLNHVYATIPVSLNNKTSAKEI
jgi:hypothetical protein